MTLFIARSLLTSALCLAIGLHWVALQSIAWTTMLAANAKQTSFVQAIAKTFDGNHPCDLCKRINTAQHSPKKPEVQPTQAKSDLICAISRVRIIPPFRDYNYSEGAFHFFERGNSPPVPPPRAAFA